MSAASAAPEPTPRWPDVRELDAALAAGRVDFQAFRAALQKGSDDLAAQFRAGKSIDRLVRGRARLVDALLTRCWKASAGVQRDAALIAVGGYGRGELHPGSDVDVMVLLPGKRIDAAAEARLSEFVTLLWDIGLEVGHSVRTVRDCVLESRKDITVATSLMEARLLAGPRNRFEDMLQATGPANIWSSKDFFEAKLAEQEARHHRYHDTAYNLEPNVKGSPGGMRDIQMIGWVAKRHFGAGSLHQLVAHGFLTRHEYKSLREGRAFLWRVRFALHMLTGRREDRLLFDHQVRIAELFGYRDSPHALAVEQLMQAYYRTVMKLSRLNEMLLQLFREAILTRPGDSATCINDRFQVRHGHLDARDDEVFARHPTALLEVFLLLQQQPDLQGVSARTIRLIRRYRNKINDSFRQNPEHHRLFLEILRAPTGVTHELRRMNRYGILGRYIPAFGRIVGRMQYDLFHAYTVDAHTLFVVSNLRRFALTRFNHEFPYCSQIMQSLPKPELAYLAGLFHDIAKGRGGDHSILGAEDAEVFCLGHGLGRYDSRLIAWLVKHHLTFSVTAQKKDISDPQVINEFAAIVGDQLHLDYLYVLTVADVRATSPKLWNSWKASLFQSFYLQIRKALQRGLENPVDRDELIDETRKAALEQLLAEGLEEEAVRSAWSDLGENYFLRHSAEEIAWHTALLVRRYAGEETLLVSVREPAQRGGTAILIYSAFVRHTFAIATAVLDRLGLTIVEAQISATSNGFSLDTYLVIEANGQPITDPERIETIERTLRAALAAGPGYDQASSRRVTRAQRVFSTPTKIEFTTDQANRRTVMELVAADRPGMLSKVARSFRELGADVHTARITTVGERAEDVFYLTDVAGRPLDEADCATLHENLFAALNAPTD